MILAVASQADPLDESPASSEGFVSMEISRGVRLVLNTIPGTDYQLQYSTNNAVWVAWGSPFPGSTNALVLHAPFKEHAVVWRLNPVMSGTNLIKPTNVVCWPKELGGNDHWYEVVRKVQTIRWNDARQAATNRGGYLAVVTSPAENRFVADLVSATLNWRLATTWNQAISGPWIGACQLDHQTRKDQGWQWVNGEAWSYAGWHAYPNVSDPTVFPEPTNGGQPETAGNVEKYAHCWRHRADAPDYVGWNDAGDGEPVYSYIVEYETRPLVAQPVEVIPGRVDIRPAIHLTATLTSAPCRIESTTNLVNWFALEPRPTVADGFLELWLEMDSPHKFFRVSFEVPR